jgi:hypothetical protein
MSVSRSPKVIASILESGRRITALSVYRALPYFLITVIIFFTGCGGGEPQPLPPSSGIDGPVNFLTTGNLNGNDDDPTVAIDPQGNIHIVWFSDRDGTKDLYAVHSTAIDLASGTITWSAPIHITDNAPALFPPPMQGDEFPSFVIDSTGTHHLAWHRIDLSNQSHILYAKSDGTAAGWAAATVVPVTTGANFDRFASLVRVSATDLRIFFISHTRVAPIGKEGIFVSKSTDNGASWGAPTEVATLNSSTEQSSLPNIVRLPSGLFTAAFQRWKLNPSNDVFDLTSDIFYAESNDGDTWTTSQVTVDASDNQNDLAPAFFFDHAGTEHLAWSTQAFGDPAEDLVQMKVSDRASYPNLTTRLTSTPGLPDHSPKIVPMTINGQQVFVMIWVRIQTQPHNQVVYRVFSAL